MLHRVNRLMKFLYSRKLFAFDTLVDFTISFDTGMQKDIKFIKDGHLCEGFNIDDNTLRG